MKKITADAFSSGMRGDERSFDKSASPKGAQAKQTRKIMAGTATAGAGETAASDAESTKIKTEQSVPVPAVFASGMRGMEKQNTDGTTVADSEAAATPQAEVQKAESDAGLDLPEGKHDGVHNSAEIVGQDDTHLTLRIPKKILLGKPAKAKK